MAETYHHGDLPQAVLAASAVVIARDGVDQLSLRSVATELGVSHTAPRHHFGSREGVFTALAVQGFTWLATELEKAAERGGFDEVGAAYVQFALDHPGHFAVMFRPDLVDGSAPALTAASRQTAERLRSGAASFGAASPAEGAVSAIAAWSMVHGLGTLLLSGALDESGLQEQAGGDVHSLTVRAARRLFQIPEPLSSTDRSST